jgi:hypothetical protein
VWLKHIFTAILQTIPGTNKPLGTLVLESRAIFPEAKCYWIGVGALLGYVLLFNILYTVCLTFLDRESEITFILYANG